MLFNEPYVNEYVAHWEPMPRAKTVGVAHSSYRHILVGRFSSTVEFIIVFADGRIRFLW
jgi:hypothetical protein